MIPHLAVPFTLAADGSVAVVEQDTLDEVLQCVRVLLATPQGSRDVVPGFGIPDPTFTGVDETAVQAAVADWEPRASVTLITSYDGMAETMTVGVVLAVDA